MVDLPIGYSTKDENERQKSMGDEIYDLSIQKKGRGSMATNVQPVATI